MTEEDEAFNEIERQAKQRKESVMAAVHTLTEYQRGYETGFIDGMQKQAQSSVDKAVNAMSQRTEQTSAERTLQSLGYINNGGEYWKPPLGKQPSPQRTWVGLTDEEIWTILQFRGYNTETIEIAKAIEAKLKEKNT
jgi:hypothetical protein